MIDMIVAWQVSFAIDAYAILGGPHGSDVFGNPCSRSLIFVCAIVFQILSSLFRIGLHPCSPSGICPLRIFAIINRAANRETRFTCRHRLAISAKIKFFERLDLLARWTMLKSLLSKSFAVDGPGRKTAPALRDTPIRIAVILVELIKGFYFLAFGTALQALRQKVSGITDAGKNLGMGSATTIFTVIGSPITIAFMSPKCTTGKKMKTLSAPFHFASSVSKIPMIKYGEARSEARFSGATLSP